MTCAIPFSLNAYLHPLDKLLIDAIPTGPPTPPVLIQASPSTNMRMAGGTMGTAEEVSKKTLPS